MMNLLYANETAGRFPPSWYAESARPAPDRAMLNGAVNADICIIGAGFTGVSAALHLAERGYRVVVLEAHRVGWGASGRNGGQVGSGQRVDQPDLEKQVGRDDARLLWEVSQDAKQLVKDLVHRFDMDCALKPGIIHANHRKRFDRDSEAYVDHMARHYDHDLTYLPPSALRREVNSPRYSGGYLDLDAAHLHPLNYIRGLARGAEFSGAQIFEMSEATNVSGGVVATAKGQVKAREVVVACNGYLGGLVEDVPRYVMPINNFIVATEPLNETQAKGILAHDYAVADSKFVVNYFRLSEDRRLLFGGRESYGYKFPHDIKGFVRKAMVDIFPQMTSVAITHGWGGTLAITMSRLPYLARQDGFWTSGGYSGHGVALATMAGRILADAIAGQTEKFDVMARIPATRFPGGVALRHPLLVAAMLWYGLRDRL